MAGLLIEAAFVFLLLPWFFTVLAVRVIGGREAEAKLLDIILEPEKRNG